jgi:hypothetical protein
MSELAHYVVESYAHGITAEFPNLFATIERLLQIPDSDVEALITIGLLEDIQSIASHRDFGFSVFRPWLGPQSLRAWDEVDAGMKRVAAWEWRNRRRWWQFWRRKPFDARKALKAGRESGTQEDHRVQLPEGQLTRILPALFLHTAAHSKRFRSGHLQVGVVAFPIRRDTTPRAGL